MESVAVFDLNQTLYQKSSKDEFFKYICFRRNQKLAHAAQMFCWYLLKNLNVLSETTFKENFFNYLNGLHPDKVQEYAREFWSVEFPKHFNKEVLREVERLQAAGIKCCICSGALAVYMSPLKEFLPMDRYIASKTVYRGGTYKIVGKSCGGAHKLTMLREVYGNDVRIVEAYSDQEEPLLDAAEKAFLIQDGVITPYLKAEVYKA
jgi:phosphoserine phosphatase